MSDLDERIARLKQAIEEQKSLLPRPPHSIPMVLMLRLEELEEELARLEAARDADDDAMR